MKLQLTRQQGQRTGKPVSAKFSKQSILAPTAKIQSWWQAPKPPAEAETIGGAIQVSAGGAMQVPVEKEKGGATQVS